MKFMQIKPQKARGKFLESMWTDPAYSAENKEDGDRRLAQFCSPWVRFTGTRESVDGTGFVEKTANLPQLHIAGVPCKLEGTVLDGEIVAPWAENLPGGSSKHVTAIMGSLPDRAIELQQKYGWLEYRVFDCLWWRGTDMRGCNLGARRLWAEEALRIWKNKYATLLVPVNGEQRKRLLWKMAREGLVFKHEDHTYGNERLWVKLKKEATADVVVMGFEPGRGKYAGSVGAIIFGQYRYRSGVLTLDQCGTCRGFTDTQMNAFHKAPKRYVGRTFRITHNGREPTGKFRHPRFDCWRDDKDPHDCIWYPEES